MHHSEDRNRQLVAFTCYMDDSGTEEQSKIVVIGGFTLDHGSFTRFDLQWRRMLKYHGIDRLHMKDFVRPFGKYSGMYPELKKALFTRAAKIITSRRMYGLSVSLQHAEFKEAVPMNVYRGTLGPYTAAFIAALQFNAKLARDNGSYPDRVAYVIDEIAAFSEQMRVAHKLISLQEKTEGKLRITGTLTFGDDDEILPLQGADVVAWASRRKHSGDGLTEEFAPLEQLFQERFTADGLHVRPHFHYSVNDDTGRLTMEAVNAELPKLLKELDQLTDG
jgi:Protein of unknown function (DUF3800)